VRLLLAIVVCVAAGCSGEFAAGDDTTGDAPAGCSVSVMFDPMMAIAGPATEIRASAIVTGAPGVLSYSWEVTHGGADVTYTFAQLDHSAISFIGADPGPYRVMVAITGGGSFCPTGQADVNVGVPGGALSQVRLRVFPPSTVAAPPQEKLQLIPGGTNYSLNNVAIEPGIVATGSVRMGTAPVPAYLRFIPLGGRDAYIEAFAGSDGAFSARMLNQVHDVLVVPTAPGFAPRLVQNWMPGTSVIPIDAGFTVTGVVRDPAGNPLANAQVQLILEGVPSTLTTTTATGAFTVLATSPVVTPDVRVEVTPPMTSGLPRIAGGSTAIAIANPITVQYSAALARRDLGGTVVRRGGVAQANAPVKIVGTISAVATITAGGTAMANGEVRIATQTNGAGAIPSGVLAPATPLFAVSTIGAQLAVDAIDLTTAVPASINAPPAVQLDTQLKDAAAVALPNALLDLVPAGALAMAGAPTLRGYSNASGNLTLMVPAGGRFDVRASDPQGRAAPLLLLDVPTASLSATYALKPSLHVTGAIVLSGNPQVVGRATVQILCTLCTGVERSRPLAEGATSSAGSFDLAIFDPGVN
jgi:hypothetical protein